jgi:hypothetical protein
MLVLRTEKQTQTEETIKIKQIFNGKIESSF